MDRLRSTARSARGNPGETGPTRPERPCPRAPARSVPEFPLPFSSPVLQTQSERFQAKWIPVRVKKTRKIKNLDPRFDSIETEKALAQRAVFSPASISFT